MADQRTKNLTKGFDEASKTYGDDPKSGFDHYGKLLAEFSGAVPGEHVLDVACGTGAISLPLAQRIGPTGRLLGVDISQGMLDRAAGYHLHPASATCRRIAVCSAHPGSC